MPIIKCQNGHFYSSETFDGCPYCSSVNSTSTFSVGQNIISDPIVYTNHALTDAYDKTIAKDPMRQDFDTDKTIKYSEVSDDNVKTQRFVNGISKVQPVVGWLVCTCGSERGRDYRVYSEKNFIGRDYSMEIIIANDKTVANKNHACIVFDPLSCFFTLINGDGVDTRINDNPVFSPVQLTDGDKIRIGSSEYIFIAYCRKDRQWI